MATTSENIYTSHKELTTNPFPVCSRTEEQLNKDYPNGWPDVEQELKTLKYIIHNKSNEITRLCRLIQCQSEKNSELFRENNIQGSKLVALRRAYERELATREELYEIYAWRAFKEDREKDQKIRDEFARQRLTAEGSKTDTEINPEKSTEMDSMVFIETDNAGYRGLEDQRQKGDVHEKSLD